MAKSFQFITFLLVLLLSGLVHGINMFSFPYYENDEGTYMSQAWSLSTMGKLSPNTYTYDHAPAGWILISLWTALNGDYFNYGFSINSGRVLMLLLHLGSALFLYLLTKKMTGNHLLSLGAIIIFSLSPLAIYFHRRVLIDNIMVFWLLLSFVLIFYSQGRSLSLLLSGLIFGLATVTKETALLFFPILFYYLAFIAISKRFKILLWLLSVFVPIFVYLLYALFRGELFSSPNSVSLFNTWSTQLSRQFDSISLFRQFQQWLYLDPVLIGLSIWSLLTNFIVGLKRFPQRLAFFSTILYILFLFRGGIVMEFYIIPLIPFLAINIILTIHRLIDVLVLRYSYPSILVGFIFSLTAVFIGNLLFYGNRFKGYSLFFSDQTWGQINAVNWILSQKQPDTFYAIDNYAYVDLHAKNQDNFKYAEYYWKVDYDPEIRTAILADSWQFITYLTVTPQMDADLASSDLPLLKSARTNSSGIQSFYRDGWGVSINLVKP